MKVISISYQKTIPTGPYMNDRLGVEIELEPGETAEQALTSASQLIDKWHRDNNPQLYPTGIPAYEIKSNGPGTWSHKTEDYSSKPASIENTPNRPLTKEEKRQQQVAGIIQQINEATDLKVVEAFHLIVKNYPEVKEAYDKKIDQLQNKNQ